MLLSPEVPSSGKAMEDSQRRQACDKGRETRPVGRAIDASQVWGLLANGELFIYVVPEGQAMRKSTYAWLVEHRFAKWIAAAFGDDEAVYLLQDHERCLWSDEPREQMKARKSAARRPHLESAPSCCVPRLGAACCMPLELRAACLVC